MFGLAVVPAAIFGMGMLFLPESPRWLARRGHHEKARAMLSRIRGTSDVSAELQEIERSLAHADERGRLSDLFAPSVRPALVVGIGLAIFQQVTGINTVIYYAPLIIQSAGISSESGALVWLAVISMMVYVASFAISLGPIFWLLISEIYPLKIRSSSEGLAAAFNWGSNLLVSLTFLTLLEVIGSARTFWLYGVFAIAAWIFSYFRVPETKGRTLEEIEEFWRARRT